VPDDSQPGPAAGRRLRLRADCERCFALCCVAPAFSASADFAIDKRAGQPCPNLRPDFRCSIHDRLRPRGFPGCVSYDCFGAGQQVAQVTFGGRDWRQAPGTAAQMFRVFTIMRQLHELLWYLTEALALPAAGPLHGELGAALAQTERLTRSSPAALAKLDVRASRDDINVLLLRASTLVRASARQPGANLTGADLTDADGADLSGAKLSGAKLSGADLTDADLSGADLSGAELRGADLTGRDLSGADLAGASLRGARLIGADLSGAGLRMADLTGADLRGADLSGADLSECFFLGQSQLDAARGDQGTRLPAVLTRPAHWPAGRGPAGPAGPAPGG